MFENDLTTDLERSGHGVTLSMPVTAQTPGSTPPTSPNITVNHLIYADDLVCIAPSEIQLQSLIDIVNLWCCKFRIEANLLKTEILHVRKPLKPKSNFKFKFDSKIIKYCQQYKYLGLTIDQFLNFEKMSNSLLAPSSRALSAIMCKMIKNKGFPHDIYKILYNTCVTSIKDYAHEVIGFHEYSGATSLHNRTLRLYLGVGNSANLCGLRSEMARLEPRSRTQLKMPNFYMRVPKMDNTRLKKQIFLYDQNFCSENQDKTCWSTEVNKILTRNNLLFSINNYQPKLGIQILHDSLLKKDLVVFRTNCLSATKLRTYNTLFSPLVPHMTTVSFTRLC